MRRKLLVLTMAMGTLPLLAGCAFLGGGVPYDEEGYGKPLATYGSGHATLAIDGRTIVLDKLSAGPHLYDGLGADVYWYNDDGWGLRLGAFDGGFASSNDITIDRVQTTYWSAPGYGDCQVKVEKVDETGVKGSATCDGLRWTDRLRGGTFWTDGERYVESEPAFEATVSFEAVPADPVPSSEPSASPGASPAASPSSTPG